MTAALHIQSKELLIFFLFSMKVILITIIVIFYNKSVEKHHVQAGMFLMN